MSAPYSQQYDPTPQMLVTPQDTDALAREQRLRAIGVGTTPVAEFDAVARDLARTLGTPYAMVNFIDTSRQYFAGLFTPADGGPGVELGPQQASTESDRVMAKDYGWCPHVVVRKKALVLEDVYAYRKFAANPVISELNIRAYIGAPLMDWRPGPDGGTPIALGTVCAIVPEEITPWGREGLEIIKSYAAGMVERLKEIEKESGRF
ncbi:GAF domain-containing protein [Streptomyces sp. NPDC047009]|uniref:GAF domain-containing protein n=1 Tax=Streptomyces sp. NPDC047009 TaxID=3154496 RepID=UPI0033CE7F63